MDYAKPEITSFASANFVIQSTGQKTVTTSLDSHDKPITDPAYEADE